MPLYDYACAACGPFAEFRPMSAFRDPCGCPTCGAPAERSWTGAPRLAVMDPAAKRAHGVNERSANAPRRNHGAGCGCCGGGSAFRPIAAGGAKSFAGARPWMISH